MRTLAEKPQASRSAVPREARARHPETRGPALQMKRADGGVPPRAALPMALDILRSPGHALDPGSRALLEQRLQQDFGAVRVHADAQAADAARAVGARAYTVGQNIVFGRGEYRPGSPEGMRLLAHELAHVVQQRRGVSLNGGMGRAGDGYEQQADAVADAVVAGRPAGGLLSAPSSAGSGAAGSGGVAIQRQAAPAASEAPKEEEETLVTEGDWMRKAVIDAARGRDTAKTTIMSQEEIEKIRKGYTQEYKVKVDGKEETRTRSIAPMANYTTCVEFAGQTYGDAITARSKKLGRTVKESQGASRLLSDTKRILDAEYQLQAEIDAYNAQIKLNRASLEDSQNRFHKTIDGPKTRQVKALAEQARLESEKTQLEGEAGQLETELATLIEARDAASASGDKDRAKELDAQVKAKRLELLRKRNALLGTRQRLAGQGQLVTQLRHMIDQIDGQKTKTEAMIAKRTGKLAELDKQDDMIIRPPTPLAIHPKRGEYVLLGAGAAQSYGVKKETSVTLGKGAFKHIAVFDRWEPAPSTPGNPDEKWERWHTIDGGDITSTSKSILVCVNDLRVAPGASEKPWFASKTVLIGWVDMNILMARAAPGKPTGATPGVP
ncbi:DUF4157 domain-containing protein [Sphingomonas sp. HF-S4]|uniref:DUF4157 domain-containing protein n=1 Tax=Sphingomonas agrestis TaxID=3080540 RepID=A0ABU3YAZ8_9SPHN|nr:DUF4157 domain-containing protein [Sphingomonas sp. HF-S4]MDV3458333.1 DUF4157 domain-containing protein [Sphingomonas sp. HF-S4]